VRNKDGEVRNVLFVSYAREDRDTCSQVVPFLSHWANRLGYEVWWDRFQRPGRPWNEQINAQLARTGAAIVLVSIDALDSGFIWEREIKPLLKAGVPVAPLLVRACPWEAIDVLKELQFLAPPGTRVGLNELQLNEQEQVITAISSGLKTWLPAVEDGQRREHGEEAQQREPVDNLPKLVPGVLHGVPGLPAEYQPRTDLLNDFRAQLLGGVSGTAGITTPPRTGLYGSAGVGKSVLASALAHDDEVRLAFPDGIYWVTVGDRPDIATLQASLADELRTDISEARTNRQRREMLSAAIGDRRCLFVIDDVWDGPEALSFNLSGPFARVLYTTRQERILALPGLRATRLAVSPLSRDEAIRFVQNQIGSDEELPSDAIAVIEQSGRVIFALSLAVGAYLNSNLSWSEISERFAASASLYPEELEANLRAMRVAMSTLDDEQMERYRDLVVFPTDEAIPISTIEKFWDVWDLDTRELLRRFQDGRLLEVDGNSVRFHDDQILYLSGRTNDQESRNSELLDAHRPPSGQWHDLPHDDRYMWNHLVRHLIKAGAYTALDELSGDIDWIAQHWFLNGPSAVDRDLQLLAQQDDARRMAHKVLRRVRGIGHLMRGMKELSSVADTLALHLSNLGASSGLSRHASPDWIAPAIAIDPAIEAVERVLPGHQGGTLAVTAFPWKDGWHLASAGADEAVKIWDPFAADQDPMNLRGHAGWVGAVFAFCWRGDWHCASGGGDDRKVRVWSIAEPDRAPLVLRGQTERVTALTGFEEDGDTFLCVGSGDRYIRVYRLSDQQLIASFRGHSGRGHSLVAYKDDHGWRVTSGGSDGVLKTWDPLEGKFPREIHAIECRSPVTSLTLFIDRHRRYLATGHADGSLSICSADGTQRQEFRAHSAPVEALVSFEDDGVVSLVSASTDGVIEVRCSVDGFATATSYREHISSVTAVSAFPADDRWHLVSASMDGSIRIWDLTALGSEGTRPEGHRGQVHAIAECRLRDQSSIATVSEDATLRVWPRDASRAAVEVISPEAGPLVAVTSWQAEGGSVVSWGARDGSLGSVSLRAAGTVTAQRNKQRNAVNGICSYIAGDGRRMLATAGRDLRVRIWDSARLSGPPRVLRAHYSRVNAICAFEFEGSPRLITVSDDCMMVMWDPERQEPLVLTRGHPAAVRAVAVFRDELSWKAVTGADDGVVRVIDLEADAMPRDLGEHAAPVSSVAVLGLRGGGQRVASGSDDGRLMLWDPWTGELTAQVGVGHTISGLCTTSVAGELGVAYDARWTILSCYTPLLGEPGM
jgi:WD40 repeat protein